VKRVFAMAKFIKDSEVRFFGDMFAVLSEGEKQIVVEMVCAESKTGED
jgi:hypothetical protein